MMEFPEGNLEASTSWGGGGEEEAKNPPVYMNERTQWKALPFTPLKN